MRINNGDQTIMASKVFLVVLLFVLLIDNLFAGEIEDSKETVKTQQKRCSGFKWARYLSCAKKKRNFKAGKVLTQL